MAEARPLRTKDFLKIALVQAVAFALLVWLEVRRSFTWRDALVGIFTGLLLTSAWAGFLHLKRSFNIQFPTPSHRFVKFILLFVQYWSLFILVYGIPVAEGRIFHPKHPGGQSWTWVFGFGAWMAFFFAMKDVYWSSELFSLSDKNADKPGA